MPANLDLLRATLGDRYVIERELGRGGMGAVYLARDRRLDRPVALKVLPPEYGTDPGLRERFLRETRTAASFSHPNIVPVFAVEESAGLLAFAMGFVEGESLAARVQRAGPLTSKEVVRLLQDIGYALAYAHGRGVVHRDIKPDNIMLERATGRALLMDFGISRTISTAAAAPGLTRVGEVVGTPEFMSPEQACGDVVDGRSDLYSLGLVAYFALAGRPAITGDSTQRILMQQLTQPVPSVGAARPDLPAALVETVDRCTRKEPAERFATAEALVEALDAAQLAEPEVPFAIREFAREVGTRHWTILITLAICGAVAYYITQVRRFSLLDALFEMSVVVAVMVARLWYTISEKRRLNAAGFTREAILRGFRGIVDERAAARAALRAQPAVVARRRRTLLVAAAVFALSFAGVRVALAARTQIGPFQYRIPPWAIGLIFASYVARGASMVAILRTPLRMPIGERLFRLVWLGAPGRWLLRDGRRTAAPGRTVPPTGTPSEPVLPVAPPAGPAPAADPAVLPLVTPRSAASAATLEARVAELERWRAAEEARRRAAS